MELQRNITAVMQAWYENPGKRALLVTGARQVGKTYAVRAFTKERYGTVVEINFAQTPSAKAIFDGDLDAGAIIANLTAFSLKPLVPGDTLIFLDEIQECPNARAAIKFLVDDGRFDYIESGSLLGVLSRGVPSLPVGYEQVERMYPLDMREFFRALGVQDETFDLLRTCYDYMQPVPTAVHDRMIRLTRLYLAVGGMPAAVDRFAQTSDLAQVLGVQRDILELYRLDIAKYAQNKPHVKAIFDALPAELAKANKRFKLRDLAPSARMERYESDFMWLVDAGVALPCYNVRAPQASLTLNEQRNLFKFYLADVGLLGGMLEQPAQFELVKGDPAVNEGGVVENLAAQELTAHGFKLHYFDKSRYGEVDFILPGRECAIPVEMKSGRDYRAHRALDNILAIDEWGIKEGLVFCNGQLRRGGKVTYLPWYMLMFLKPDGERESFIVDWRTG